MIVDSTFENSIREKNCYFGFIFIEGKQLFIFGFFLNFKITNKGQEIILGMKLLALAVQLASIILLGYSVYNISSPSVIKRYYFHSAGECLAATGIRILLKLFNNHYFFFIFKP